MPIVNYIREHMRFMEYASEEQLSAGERLLWYALMHVMNQRAEGNVWPDGFIRIRNDQLLLYCPMQYDTLARARNGLKQRGLIEYKKGEKNKVTPSYRMIYFCPEYASADPEAHYPEGYPHNAYNIHGNMGGNITGNNGDNMRGNAGCNVDGNNGDFYINDIQGKRTSSHNHTVFENKDEEEEDPYFLDSQIEKRMDGKDELYARAREEIVSAWAHYLGGKPTPIMLDTLAERGVACGFRDGVLAEAIKSAGMRGANSPFDYILAVIGDWHHQHVVDVADAQEYSCLREMAFGKLSDSHYGYKHYGSTAEEASKQLENFRRDRETPEERERRIRNEKLAAEQEEQDRWERDAIIARNRDDREKAEYEIKRAKLDREYKKAASVG